MHALSATECCIRNLYYDLTRKKNAKFKTSLQKNYLLTIRNIIICKTCHSKVIKGKVPCQAAYNDMFVDEYIPIELPTFEKLEQILIAQRIVFQKIVVMPKGQQRKIKKECPL